MSKPKSAKQKIKVRRRWKVNPKTKIEESAKRYVRTREKRKTRKVIKNAV